MQSVKLPWRDYETERVMPARSLYPTIFAI
jgi:hypothetical protein